MSHTWASQDHKCIGMKTLVAIFIWASIFIRLNQDWWWWWKCWAYRREGGRERFVAYFRPKDLPESNKTFLTIGNNLHAIYNNAPFFFNMKMYLISSADHLDMLHFLSLTKWINKLSLQNFHTHRRIFKWKGRMGCLQSICLCPRRRGVVH